MTEEQRLPPDIQDLADMEGAAMARQIQRRADLISHLIMKTAVNLAIDLVHDPERLDEYMKKFELEKK